jgi:AcrR family transcriptional regulator
MDQKFQEIIKSASRIFRKYGIKSVSMDDICNDIGISKKTLYDYFENKSQLVEHVIKADNKLIFEVFENQSSRYENAIDALLAVSLQACKSIPEVTPAFSYDLKKYYPDLYEMHLNEKRKTAYDLIIRNAKQGIEQGYFRKELEVDAIARLYIQKIENVMTPEYIFSSDFDTEHLFKVMFENHIRGIANEKGIEYFEQKVKNLNIKI